MQKWLLEFQDILPVKKKEKKKFYLFKSFIIYYIYLSHKLIQFIEGLKKQSHLFILIYQHW